MSPIEIRPVPNYRWRMALIGVVGCVGFYLYFGYLPLPLWVLGGVGVVLLIHSAIRGESTEPCVILDDEGVLDKRLKVGVINWDDIRRISLHDLYGAQYVSLELHNQQTYEARRPPLLKLAAKAHRLHRMSPISISTSGLEVDTKTLANLIHAGCEKASQRRVEVTS